MQRLRIIAAKSIIIYLAWATAAYAEVPFQLPSPNLFDAGQMQRYLRTTTVAKPVEKAAPEVKQEGLKKPTPVAPQADKIRLTLNRVIIQGNHVFCTSDLEKVFAPHLHKNISLADLQNDVEGVSRKYREAGYVLSRAFLPAQKIEHGIVRVQVIEGYISKVEVTGDPGLARNLIQQHGNIVLCSRPLKICVLEHEILLANDIPGIFVQAVITPSKNIPGSADLTLSATRKVASGYVTYDNFGTRYLGPLETGFGGNLNSILPGDTNALHFAFANQTDEMSFYEFMHTQVINVNGLNYTLGTSYTQTKPGFTLDPFHIVGRSFSIYGYMVYPVIRTRETSLFFRTAANYQNVSSTILTLPYYNDLIRSIGAGGYFTTTDCLKGADSLEIFASKGLPIMGAVPHVNQSRPRGRERFTKCILNALRTQPISTSRFSILTALQSQYSFTPLLATEQYAYGGALFGRGYDPAEIVGDRGLAGKAELHMLVQPEWKFLNSIDFFLFYDAGEVWNMDRVNQIAKLSATSTGIGANFDFMPYLRGQFYVAKPLSRKVAVLVQMDQNPNQARTFFQLIASI